MHERVEDRGAAWRRERHWGKEIGPQSHPAAVAATATIAAIAARDVGGRGGRVVE